MAKRVALVSSSYHPHHGGVETHVRQVARELQTLGHAVEVWTVDRGENLGTTVLDGIVVRYLPTPLPSRSVRALASFLRSAPVAMKAWRQAERAFRPDVVHVQCFGPNGPYAAGLARALRLPLVVSSHGETFADDHGAFEQSALLRRALRHSVKQAIAVTGCSRIVTDELAARFGAHDSVVVPNGVDLECQGASRHAARASSPMTSPPAAGGTELPGPVVLGIGRLERNKGFDLLVTAMAEFDRSLNATVVVGGDGSQRRSLEEQAVRLGVADRIHFLGALDADQVAQWMRRAAVVVVPSRVEAFGIVVLEAWRAGTPVIGTSLGGPGTLISHGVDGLVVDPTDSQALATSICELIADRPRARALAASGWQTVQGFTWRHTAEAYDDIYAPT